jgi:hypothetical protein
MSMDFQQTDPNSQGGSKLEAGQAPTEEAKFIIQGQKGKWFKILLFSFLTSLPVSAGIAALGPGVFWNGWLAAFILTWISIFCLTSVWWIMGGSKILAWMVALAFVLRLVVGIGLSLGLPVFGYDEDTQNSGYLFRDAQHRDNQAWVAAQQDEPIWTALNRDFYSDQYGGLLSLSALVYRCLSPDSHRPFLILILAAFAAALGIPFLFTGLRLRWNTRLASLAAWGLVFYPDGILFSASQMREPFLIGFGCIAFWGALTWGRVRRWHCLAVILLSMLGMALISSRAVLAVGGFLAIWFFLDQFLGKYSQKWLVWLGVAAACGAVLLLSANWFLESSNWDMSVTEASSGWIHKIIMDAGEQFRIPIIIISGLTQPVLPATIAEPTLLIWKLIMIPRAAGWYLLAPLLIYASYAALWVKPAKERRIILWLAAFSILWLVIASARAGGDLWDNPRYRLIFLPWLILLAAWGVYHAIEKRDAWLVRWLLVEVIFLGFFTNWYFSRYFLWWGRMYFWQTVAWILVLSAVVLASGWIWGIGKKILGKN